LNAAAPVLRYWGTLATALMLAAAVFVLNRHRFDWAFELVEIPAIGFAIGLSIAGLLVLPLPWLITKSADLPARQQKQLLAFIVIVGLALRASMFLVQPVLEDDYYRYLWDGSVTAHGLSPYALAPATAKEEGEETAIGRLAEQAGVVMDRINHTDLKTIYPPVAQAAFALAHLIEPWSLRAWRAVCFAGEVATLILLSALLIAAKRSPLWVALYWWNPLIIKEMSNSAHMEAVLMPLVLGAVLLSLRGRMLSAAGVLGLAAGAKLWPILLVPILLRPLWPLHSKPASSLKNSIEPAAVSATDPLPSPLKEEGQGGRVSMRRRGETGFFTATTWKLFAASLILGLMMTAWVVPPYLGGIDETSGFVAFANYWQTNSALFPVVAAALDKLLLLLRLPAENAGLIARAILGLTVAATAIALAIRPWTDARKLLDKVLVFSAVLFLLSPAQFPWYAAWMMPFLSFLPSLPLLGLTALLPIYYASFHFLAREQYDVYRYGLVWLIWLPVWIGLGVQLWRARRPATNGNAHA
jgi:alpha-1,6-mannosyltransferase